MSNKHPQSVHRFGAVSLALHRASESCSHANWVVQEAFRDHALSDGQFDDLDPHCGAHLSEWR